MRHQIFCDFVIQMHHPIPVRRPDLASFNKKERTFHIENFAIPLSENKRKWKDRQILGSY